MVLRFRDLVAETIKEHRAIIEGKGSVWWGWWNKPDENVPKATFAEFDRAVLEKGYLGIFLVDSGNKLLYKAKLVEIKASNSEDLISCPDREKSPAYYSATKYKAWFRFSAIEDSSDDEIREWSYDEVADFVDDPYASRFQDKRVSSIEEMLNRRHRTIYFIKPFDSSRDNDYQVQLVPLGGTGFVEVPRDQNVKLVTPNELRDFMNRPVFRDSNYILHLSDLHFSQNHHNFPMRPDRTRIPLASLLDQDIKEQGYKTSPAAVLISGDFSWLGKEEEFEQAYDFLTALRSLFNLEPENLVIVPGNHDIAWSRQAGDRYDRRRRVTEPSEDAEKHYKQFFSRIYGIPPNAFLSMGRRYILGNFIALDVIGLNSCRLEQKHFAGYGFVGLPQLNDAAERMNWKLSMGRTHYRVLMLHHHLVPVTAQEEISTYEMNYSVTLDSGQLGYRALELGVDLVAHGHMHQPFASSISRAARTTDFPYNRSLGIHGAGSAGVKREDLGAIGKNSYSIYEFDQTGLTVRVRAMSENLTRFEKDWAFRFRNNPNGGLELEGPKTDRE